MTTVMKNGNYDVIIIGGSYSGLSAAMALGRSLRKVLIVDGGQPANRFTPFSHNFITHDGRSPSEIASLARRQVEKYSSVQLMDGLAASVQKVGDMFLVTLKSREEYASRKVIFATGIVDLIPDIPGFLECWGKSVLHCPYCHGYEVRSARTGIIGNGDYAFEFGALISNWTNDLTIYTNGEASLSQEQASRLHAHKIGIVEDKIAALTHDEGSIKEIIFKDGHSVSIGAVYSSPKFIQHCDIPVQLGCELTNEGYIQVDASQRTSIPGVYACGDNVTRMRTVANAVSMGTTAGMAVNKELIMEDF